MSSRASGRMGQSPRGGALISALFFLSPLLTAAAPRLSPFFLPIIGLMLIIAALRRGLDWRELLKPNAALIALVVVALYTCLSGAWAANPEGAIGKSAILLAAALVVFAATTAMTTLDQGEIARASRAFVVGVLCAAGFVTVELLTDGALTRAAMNSISLFRPERAKHMSVVGGRVTKINLSEFNQHVAMLALSLWPGLLALRALYGPRRILIMVLFFAVLAVPIALSEHDSSQVALVASLIVLPLAWGWPRAVIRGLALAWCLGFVLVLPLDFLAYKAELHQATWLPSSARARIIIWEFTAERVLERPWFGIGADSTPAVKAKSEAQPDWPKGFVYKRTTGQHAHNLFLQAWYELGLAGVILMAIAGAAVLLRIPLLAWEAQPYAVASFVMFAVMATFAWGIWQIWLMCAFALLPLYLCLAAAPFRGDAKSKPS
ncbi:MAG: O-antigen ligase family protein [Methyloceanibacter sp.]